jgi:hypothetical protein
MIVKPLFLIISPLFIFGILACHKDSGVPNMAAERNGVLTKGGYQNEFFGFQVAFPENWKVIEGRTTADESALEQGGYSASEEKKQMQLSAMRETHVAFRTIQGEEGLPNFGVTIEKVGFSSASDYLANMPKLFQGTGISFTLLSQPEKKVINGWSCHFASGLITLKAKQVYQVYLCRIEGDRLVLATLSVDHLKDQAKQASLSQMEGAFSALAKIK